MTAGIYAIVNTRTDERYIGYSVDVQQRLATHRSKLRKGNHGCPKLQAAWTATGGEGFGFILLEVCPRDPTILAVRERWWVEMERSVEHGYNHFSGLPLSPRILGYCAFHGQLQWVPLIREASDELKGTVFYKWCIVPSSSN